MDNVKETLLPILGSSYKAVKQVMFQTSTDPARPEYHFRAPGQWTDDPAGAIYYNGYYHIMYSWNPNSCLYRAGLVWKRQDQPWDPDSEEYHGFITVWGHARSKDLIHWEHLPISNYPVIDKGEEYIWYGCTAINREGVPVEIYTSVGPHKSPEATADQWIKFGDQDLIYWDNFEGNPILEINDHNDDIIRHWRDPFVFSNGEKDYMLLGGSLQNDQQHIPVLLIYEAENASFTKWKYKGIFYSYDNLEANSLECPNIVKIGNKWVLFFSPFGQVEYHIGTIDFETCTFHDEKRRRVHSKITEKTQNPN